MEYLLIILVVICYLIFVRLGHIFHQIKISNEQSISELRESLEDVRKEILTTKDELSSDINQFRKLSGARTEHENL